MNSRAKEAQRIANAGGAIAALYPPVSGEAARKMYETGDLDAGTVSVSQGVGLIRDIKPVKQIVEEMVAEAEGLIGDAPGVLR
jgi:nitronate monooxygenase